MSPAELAIPTIVLYEVECGTLGARHPNRRRLDLETGLRNITHWPFDSDAAIAAARVRVNLEKRGMLIGPLDILIAGIALSRGALLVTRNTDEFSRVPGLRITDWRS
jgi:tRNA(fMet)-specific endonuclease VapC